jgi:AcrR family transcriptional regulator
MMPHVANRPVPDGPVAATPAPAGRSTQVERRNRSRSALVEAAAQGLSRHGYANLVLDRVAAEAGYTRGALYHQFANKEDLALTVVAWVEETWWEHMRAAVTTDDPVAGLLTVAREHAIFCRRDIARLMMTLRIEFSGRDHPVGRAVDQALERLVRHTAKLIAAGRRNGTIPAGAPAGILAAAAVGAIEGLVINLSGQAPFDARLAEAAMTGLLGLPAPAPPRRPRDRTARDAHAGGGS